MIGDSLAPILLSMNSTSADILYPVLEGTSRSFYLGIQSLEQPEKDAICLGYLFCRFLDLFEDASDVSVDSRVSILAALQSWCEDIDSLERLEKVLALQSEFQDEFAGYFEKVPSEKELYKVSKTLLREIELLPPNLKNIFPESLIPMFEGMRSEIRASATPRCRSMEEFDDYCFSVAGTVGHFLSKVFLEAKAFPEGVDRDVLLEQGEAFGRALQTVNIVKDFHKDWEERRCFWPLLEGYSFEGPKPSEDVLSAILKQLYEKFLRDLERAEHYVALIDSKRPDIKFFCEFPLQMAVKNMDLAMKDTAWLRNGDSPKVPREETMALIDALSSSVA
ncbi:squalene/phytoene synthase family protein [bacterium]|nr:squalene/phytoene synthase family protein [bacterium]